jgi:hypothetical protein
MNDPQIQTFTLQKAKDLPSTGVSAVDRYFLRVSFRARNSDKQLNSCEGASFKRSQCHADIRGKENGNVDQIA